MRQVIIGNSAAGLSAIKAIREIDSCCPITLISAESCNAYSPVLITYYLKGRISKEDMFITDSDFYKMNGVETMFGSRAVEVDPLRQMVYLENGGRVGYDNLLIATGASPISLGGSEDGLTNVFSVRTVEDAEMILEHVKIAEEVVVIGGGLVGLQVSDALFGERIKITIMEGFRQVFPQSVDTDCAVIVQREIESYGISVLLGRKVETIRKQGGKAIVISDSGEEVMADMVVVGIGLKPNIELANNIGIKVNRGIGVDEMMRTNIENIFAAGDVSEGANLVTGKREFLPTWSNACRQGRIAGLNMAGCEQKYEGGLRETISSIFGLTVAAVGLSETPEGSEVKELRFSDPERKIYRKILLDGNRVIGAVLLGGPRDIGILANLIRNKKDISHWKESIANIPFDIRKLLLSIN
jgi:NAD(P)H-nitrite reductase large subunit